METITYAKPDAAVAIQINLPADLNKQVNELKDYYRQCDIRTSEGKPHNKENICVVLIRAGLNYMEQVRIAKEQGNPVVAFDAWHSLTQERKKSMQKELHQALEKNWLDTDSVYESLTNFYEVYFSSSEAIQKHSKNGSASQPPKANGKQIKWQSAAQPGSFYDTLRKHIYQKTKRFNGYYRLSNYDISEQVKSVEYDYSHDPVWNDLNLQRKKINKRIADREERLSTIPEHSEEKELRGEDVIVLRPPTRKLIYDLVTALKK